MINNLLKKDSTKAKYDVTKNSEKSSENINENVTVDDLNDKFIKLTNKLIDQQLIGLPVDNNRLEIIAKNMQIINAMNDDKKHEHKCSHSHNHKDEHEHESNCYSIGCSGNCNKMNRVDTTNTNDALKLYFR